MHSDNEAYCRNNGVMKKKKMLTTELPKPSLVPSAEASVLEGKKILIVDDDAQNKLIAATILREKGATIIETSNGQEAIELVQAIMFDLILMDIQMPVKDGWEATRAIRRSVQKDIPVIALTAFLDKEIRTKCLQTGMNDLLLKPYEKKHLLEVVSAWLRQKKSTGQLYDLRGLQNIASSNPDFVQKMIALFIEHSKEDALLLRAHYLHNEFTEMQKVAHRLKTAVNNMRIAKIKNEIREIELQAENYGSSARLKYLVDTVDSVITAVITQLKATSSL